MFLIHSAGGVSIMKLFVFIIFVIGSLIPGAAFAKSQAELDQACEDARDEKLEPLRQQKISDCKKDEDNDPQWCEQFWADYGNGGKSGGKVRQRMFDQLPECVEAEKARQDVN